MLSTIITHGLALIVGGGAGAYLHYRYGASVKNAVAQIETRIQQDVKKI